MKMLNEKLKMCKNIWQNQLQDRQQRIRFLRLNLFNLVSYVVEEGYLLCLLKVVGRGRGSRGAMIPAKITSEPQDLQNYLQAPQNLSPNLSDVTKPPAILSPRPAFWSPPCCFYFLFKFIGLTKQISKYISS